MRLPSPMGAAAIAARPIATMWNRLPVHCSLCGWPNAGAAVTPGESMAWCSSCQHVFEVPLLRIQGWVTGVIGIMIVNLHAL